MTGYVALLRAVNVGGRKLIMSELAAIAGDLGLEGARTYIASGNLIFRSGAREPQLKAMLEESLGPHMGATVPVMIRSGAEMASVARSNPFPDRPGNRVVAIFLDSPAPPNALSEAVGITHERMALGSREIYVAYGSGMADSKLRIPAAKAGTARNMNTVARLAQLAKEIG